MVTGVLDSTAVSRKVERALLFSGRVLGRPGRQPSLFPTAEWRRRYPSVCRKLRRPPAVLAVGAPCRRTDRWSLERSQDSGPAHLHFICLRDGPAGDGACGTADAIEAVRRRNGRIDWLDSRQR